MQKASAAAIRIDERRKGLSDLRTSVTQATKELRSQQVNLANVISQAARVTGRSESLAELAGMLSDLDHRRNELDAKSMGYNSCEADLERRDQSLSLRENQMQKAASRES
jgi:hypothetical protein